MQEKADFSPRLAVTAILPLEEGEWGDTRDTSEAPLELVAAAYGGTLTPEFEALVTVVQGMLAPLRDDISMLTARLDKSELGSSRSKVAETPGGPAKPPPKPQPKPPTGPKPTQTRAQVSKAPPPPREVPTPAKRGWNKPAEVGINITDSSVRQHANTTKLASAAASAQGRTPAGNPRQGARQPTTQTEVTMVRHGGFEDTEREKTLRARAPQSIVLDVRTSLEKNMEAPIKVLGGRWSSAVEKTGNFTFVLAGDVGEEAIKAAKSYLCRPFPGAEVIPNAGWVWVQLRGVSTTDSDGNLWDQDDLLRETCQNPVFEHAPLCFTPFWQVPPHKIQTETSTVMVAFRDVSGEIVKEAQVKGIYMFGRRVKLVVCGDHPSVIQCGRCHELGHHTNSPICHIPRTATRCYICGGAHDFKAHNFHCKGTHEVAGICDCRLKCIVCSKFGHHARGRGCPKRGNFAPPRLASARGPKEPAAPKGNEKELTTAPPPQNPPTLQEEDWTNVTHKARKKKKRTDPPSEPAPAAAPTPHPARTAPTPKEKQRIPPAKTPAAAPTTSKPRARIVTAATDTAPKGESYDEMLGRQAAERIAARWTTNRGQAPVGKATDPPTPASLPTEAERLEHILNNAPGPLSGPGPRFVTKERLAELDAERTTVYMKDGTAMTVWKSDIQATPLPNAIIVATEHNPNIAPPRLDERNA